jgi:hypothetical protein
MSRKPDNDPPPPGDQPGLPPTRLHDPIDLTRQSLSRYSQQEHSLQYLNERISTRESR